MELKYEEKGIKIVRTRVGSERFMGEGGGGVFGVIMSSKIRLFPWVTRKLLIVSGYGRVKHTIRYITRDV